jgi:hypothetical protein
MVSDRRVIQILLAAGDLAGGEGVEAEGSLPDSRRKEKRYWVKGKEGWEKGWNGVLERVFGTREVKSD